MKRRGDWATMKGNSMHDRCIQAGVWGYNLPETNAQRRRRIHDENAAVRDAAFECRIGPDCPDCERIYESLARASEDVQAGRVMPGYWKWQGVHGFKARNERRSLGPGVIAEAHRLNGRGESRVLTDAEEAAVRKLVRTLGYPRDLGAWLTPSRVYEDGAWRDQLPVAVEAYLRGAR